MLRNYLQLTGSLVSISSILCSSMFFLAFLPQFVSPGYGSAAVQMIYLGLTFASFGIVFLVLLGYFSGGIGSWLARKRVFTNKIRWITGSVLIALGIRLAFIERR